MRTLVVCRCWRVTLTVSVGMIASIGISESPGLTFLCRVLLLV